MRYGAQVLILWTAFSVPGMAAEKSRPRADRPVARALAFFDDGAASTAPQFLDRLRPAPVSPVLRARVLASLPTDGEVQPTGVERAKLAALEPILGFHGRRGMIAVKVIDVGHAFVGLHARSVLLLSRDALALVTAEELQALAAHELGHEYLWNEYQAAMASKAYARLQELELVCDGIAVMSLAALGLDPARLGAAVAKMTRHNQRRGATASADAYVSLGERLSFIDAMVTRLRRAG
jgi:hypothetical protein